MNCFLQFSCTGYPREVFCRVQTSLSRDRPVPLELSHPQQSPDQHQLSPPHPTTLPLAAVSPPPYENSVPRVCWLDRNQIKGKWLYVDPLRPHHLDTTASPCRSALGSSPQTLGSVWAAQSLQSLPGFIPQAVLTLLNSDTLSGGPLQDYINGLAN